MQKALVVGASGGIGRAVQRELGARGWSVTGLSRSDDGLDVTDESSVAGLLGRMEPPYQLVFVATGALVVNGYTPEKTLREVTPKGLIGQFSINAVGPMLVLKHACRLLPKAERAVFAVLSARVGSIGDNRIGGWHSYRASKAALNQLIHGASIELRRTHKRAIAVSLHPGTVATDLTAKYAGRHKTVPASEAAVKMLDAIDGLTLDHSGGFLDYAGKEVPW